MPLNVEMLSEVLKHSGYNEDISIAVVRERWMTSRNHDCGVFSRLDVSVQGHGDKTAAIDRLDAASRAGGGHD
jgi:hypothetical protein